MQQHDWRGNVRELKNLVERLLIMSDGNEVGEAEVALFLGRSGAKTPPPTPPVVPDYVRLPFREARQHFERDYLAARLQANEGNVSKTAEQIGMERSHLHRKLKALGIGMK